MKKPNFRKFDFDWMAAMAQNDPVEFERLRQQAIDDFIENASPEHRARLRGLQWRIDQERRNCSPMSACIRISKMMWDHLLDSQSLLAHQVQLRDKKNSMARDSAKVLRFTTNSSNPSRRY